MWPEIFAEIWPDIWPEAETTGRYSGIMERINNNLSALFNTEDDEIYKALISNIDGFIPTTVTLPTDYDIGVIASQIEYLRQLSLGLLEQMYIDQATGEFLTYQLVEFFDSLRAEDETDAEWVQRTINSVFQQKVSRASIIYTLRDYSTEEPEIDNVLNDSAFADYCFADIYDSGYYVMPDSSIVVFVPAIGEAYDSYYYTVKITLYNTESGDIPIVQQLLTKILAAGISYKLVIKYTS